MTQLRADPNRICIIFNPTAKGEGAQRALKALEALNARCALKPTLAAGAARGLAAEAVREGFGTIVAMGGDGTIHEVLNGMADEPQGLTRSRLAVLPVGTVNVFARELGIPFRFRSAWEVLQRGQEKVIDLPEMEFETRAGRERRWFAQMAGCGLDARAVELLDFQWKKRVGQLAYVISGFRALRERQGQLRVTAGNIVADGQLVLLGNGRLYGGSFSLFENADLQDGLLDVCVFPVVNWFVVLRYACAYLSPTLLRRGRERHFQTPTVLIESAASIPLELDGEHVGHLPARGRVERAALRVVVP